MAAELPTSASLTGAGTTNAQQKLNFAAQRDKIADDLGTKSGIGPQTVASATSVDLSAVVETRDLVISGTTAITGFVVEAGKVFRCRASGAFTLTNNGAIVTQRGGDILTVAGDTFNLRATATNTVEILNYAQVFTAKIGTPTATTSGTFKDFSVDPNSTEIHIPLTNVSTTGTSPLMIQLGDSGGIETSSYSGTTIEVIGATAVNYSTGFAIGSTISAAAAFFGSLVLRRANAAGTSWTIMGVISQASTGQIYLCSGQKLLSAQLTTVRLTTVSGVPTVDTGEANIIQR